MKAIVYDQYGSPDVLGLQEVEKPVPKENEVLVKIHAASINSWDWDMIRGKPFIVRAWGLLKPRHRIPGADIAGTVEAVGVQVTKFKPGDEVYGDLADCGWGAFAEYVSARENALLMKPKSLSFEQAASIPQAGAMAIQGIRNKGMIKAGERVLMNGAAGGVGTLAIQIAKALGAHVTAVDRGDKLDALLKLGADEVIDYARTDFTANGKKYDLILDVVSNRSVFRYKRSLNPGGRFLMIGGTMSSIFEAMLLAKMASGDEGRTVGMLAYQFNQGLDFITTLFESGKLVPVIDQQFALHDTAEAFRYYTAGKFFGKIVIVM